MVPSRQRAEALRLAHARAALESGQRVWATPDVLPASLWLHREVEAAAGAAGLPRLLSGAQEWLIWRQCAAEFTDPVEFVARGALAESLRRASELASEYLLPLRDLSGAAEGTESRLLYEVQRAVQARQAAQGVTTAREAARRLDVVGGARALEFAGFAQLPPYLTAISHAREARGLCTRARPVPAVPARCARKILAAERTEELERISTWCGERLAENEQARTLVVLPGAAALRERLATLLRQSLDPGGWMNPQDAAREPLVAIEGGEALNRAPLVAHALTALALLTDALPYESLSAWLCAPYWQEPDAAGRARVDLWLRAAAPLTLDLRTLLARLAAPPPARHGLARAAARELGARLNAAAAHLEAPNGTPREWAVRVRGALDALHWPGDAPRTSEAQQTLQRFQELLNEFGELAPAVRTLRRIEALQLLNELAARATFRPASGDALITITGFLEDPIVHYDGIWVAGLDAGAWPEAVNVNPFLPVAAQQAAGIAAASAAGRVAQARDLMLAWRAAADELVLSVAARAEDLALMPSPLLQEWADEDRAPPQPKPWLPARIHQTGQLEALLDATAPPWPVTEVLPAGARLLELQSQCAFHAFGEVRLGSRALQAPEPGVTALERGSFVHRALETLWASLRSSQALHALPRVDLEALIARSVEHAAQQLWGSPLARAQLRECARARRVLAEVCVLEGTRAPFRVRDVEFETRAHVAGARLNLRIDRIDVLEAGGLAVLDYKSGAHKTMEWYGERPSHPQLLAYVVALAQDVRALATVDLRAGEAAFHGIASEKGLLPRLDAADWPSGVQADTAWLASRQLWGTRIENLVRDFLAGRAVVDPAPHACKFCDVASLCRIGERALPEEDEAEAGADE